MLKHLLKVFLRNLVKDKGYTLINLFGMVIGLSASLLIGLWVVDEITFDRFHTNGDNIFMLHREHTYSDGTIEVHTVLPALLTTTAQEELPEIINSARFSWKQRFEMKTDKNSVKERGYFADPAIFEMFSFPMSAGNHNSLKDNLNAILISESLAKSLFGDESPLGQSIYLMDYKEDFAVTGIFEDIPENSTLTFDYILPFARFMADRTWLNHWGNRSITGFVQVAENADVTSLGEKIVAVSQNHTEYVNFNIFLHPLKNLHLYTEFKNANEATGRIKIVSLFIIVGVFIILIVCINFVNLSTARAGKRAKEVGVRKTVGAKQSSLILQFISEATVITVIAMIGALIIVELLLPSFNSLTNKMLMIPYSNSIFIISLMSLTGLVSLLAGLYPAFFLSSFSPNVVLKGTLLPAKKNALRKVLVVFQFAMSTLLIIGTFSIYKQIKFIQTMNLGLDRENIIFFEAKEGIYKRPEIFRDELEQIPGVIKVSYTDGNPLSIGSSTSDPTWPGKSETNDTKFNLVFGDQNFISTFNLTLDQGRDFDMTIASDSNSFVINETALQRMGIKDPIGHSLSFWGIEGKIIGVVKDFHHASIHKPIEPVIILHDMEEVELVNVKLEAGSTITTLSSIEKLFKKYNPEFVIDYTFMDESFNNMYRTEVITGKLSNYFTILAIFISCLGLFGLASIVTQQKSREIGIRKVFGASTIGLVYRLGWSFTALAAIAFLISAPVAYWLMSKWLDSYAYSTQIGWELILGTGLMTISIAWLTVSYQSAKAARQNPAKVLKVE